MDESGITGLATSLEADGYELSVTQDGDVVTAVVAAGVDACADCLVPKPIFRSILAGSLKVDAALIEVIYPNETDQATEHA
jgi:hypothetical protein